jgi:hypothetical protein
MLDLTVRALAWHHQHVISPMTFAGEREFAGFGDTPNMSVVPGVCHPTSPRPLATVKNLQTALQGLAQRAGDQNASTPADGLVGPHTLRAVNYAVPKYASSDPVLASGRLTHPQVASFAPQLAAAVSSAPISAPAAPQMQAPAPAPSSASPSFWQAVATGLAVYGQQNSGGRPMPPAAVYYPPMIPGRGPRGPQQASVDIKAFVPAQYEHIRFNPTVLAFGAAAIVLTVLVMQKKQTASGGK